MAAGIEVYNANGTLQFAMTDRLLKEYTILVNVGATASGSVSIPALTDASVTVTDRISNEVSYNRPSTISVNSGSVSWNYDSVPTSQRDPNYQLQVMLY